MVKRLYVEKKKHLAFDAAALLCDLRTTLGITGLDNVRIINRYDVENLEDKLFENAKKTVFSEPQLDDVYSELSVSKGERVFAVEYLPGQFDQRADSAAQCIQIISRGERPAVRTARVYILSGDISDADEQKIKSYLINPVECREASFEIPETLSESFDIPQSVMTLSGFASSDENRLAEIIKEYGLAMDIDDIRFCRDYFASEKRDSTLTELRMIDTYWSDHCRHTTFLTQIDDAEFENEDVRKTYNDYLEIRKKVGIAKPVCLMDIATAAMKYLKKTGKLTKLDESEEINACTVKMTVSVDGNDEDWLLLFKNETHNHPTEIEPFGGAATCIGGAIRDPLSGRAYVYAAMRVTGAADPLKPLSETIKGKLPQRKIVTTAAAGYSSYGNQIGLATGLVDEIYHSGYAAKRMEIGAVIAAAPAKNVRRECPQPGDAVILLGGRTGRDGCGGATGSSKAHTQESLASCGAEVQKGNAPEERKLQRLFRNPAASSMIKRCNDFGAGGVSVAIGELADGLLIDLNAVPKKYEGLDGTELAISESQERMAVVVEREDVSRFVALAENENIEATLVAVVTEEKRLVMNWNGKTVCNISREFLNSNGAPKHIKVKACGGMLPQNRQITDFVSGYIELASDLNVCSKRGLSERFDSTIGAGTVLMPFGGAYQLTPIQAMIHKISVEKGNTNTCSAMAYGFNPFVSEASPYHGAYLAVVESVSKLVASGIGFSDVYLTFQEYFEKPNKDASRWGKPFSALLGAFRAQLDYGIAAIGGKDSMSGSFEGLDVPPTLVSFAVSTGTVSDVVTPEFKKNGDSVYLLMPEYGANGLPLPESQKSLFSAVTGGMRSGSIKAAYSVGFGGAAEAVMKMCFGNMLGFAYAAEVSNDLLFGARFGAFVVESTGAIDNGVYLGEITDKAEITKAGASVSLESLLSAYENKLEPVFACNISQEDGEIPKISYTGSSCPHVASAKIAKPKALIPVFPGTNCEYDTAKALSQAGFIPETVILRNLNPSLVAESVHMFAQKVGDSQVIFIPGGFSGGDEPDGSGKFITAFFRNGEIKESVNEFLKNRDGLMCGICNGFQALIKLGLVPFGEITDTDETCPTLTFNKINRHQSRLVRTRVASNMSPWLSGTSVGDIYTVPISHGEGRFIASGEMLDKLIANGRIATQYVDLQGNPTSDVRFNPNGSVYAVEGITSPDGRVLGKMGHSERTGNGLYLNVNGNYDMNLFTSAYKYFS